jgi:hypothetical protein
MLSTTLEATCRTTESAYIQLRATSRVHVPFRDRENRSSEVIPRGEDTKSTVVRIVHVHLGLRRRQLLSFTAVIPILPRLLTTSDHMIRNHSTEIRQPGLCFIL